MSTVSWDSLWPALLREAADASSAIVQGNAAESGKAASSILVARAAWECYVNEFIEWRRLPRNLQGAPINPKIQGIAERLQGVPDAEDDFWRELLLVHDIRNAVVHFKATERPAVHGPKSLPSMLLDLGVITTVTDQQNWESQVLRAPVAVWACKAVGRVIIALESHPSKRKRSVQTVRQLVVEALRAIEASR